MSNSVNHPKITQTNAPTDKQNDDERKTSRLSYIHKHGTEPLMYMTIGNLIERAADKYGHIEAIVSVSENRRFTYRDISIQADKLAAGFHRLGLRKGDRIGLWAPNVAEWVIVFSAATRIGLITVTIDPKYQAPELKHVLNTCEVKALVCLDEYKSLNFYGILLNLAPELEKAEAKSFSSENLPTLKIIITISKATLTGTYNYYEILNSTNATWINDQSVVLPDDVANIHFSSGTTGKPKAVCLSHFQMVNNAYNLGKRWGLDDGQHIHCIQVPLFHVFGVVICVLSGYHNGTTLVFPSPLYNSRANLNAIEEERCTTVCGTPTMYVDLINLQNKLKKKINIERAFIAGAPLSSTLINNIREILKIDQIIDAYGATELTAVTFQSFPNAKKEVEAMGSILYIGEHIEAKVIDTDQNVVPFGTPGELCIRGYLTMQGYWEEPDQTRKVLDEKHWYKTGDQFILYEDGRGKVVGRLKDVIIRGGENISPTEIEEFLHTHPAILEAYVIGIENERLGEEVGVCIRLKEGAELNLETLREYCIGNIANYKIPCRIKIMKEFPKTASGKVQKFALKQQFNTISD